MISRETIQKIRELRQKGENVSKIARTLHLSRPTVLKYSSSGKNPSQHQRSPLTRKIVTRPQSVLYRQPDPIVEPEGEWMESADATMPEEDFSISPNRSVPQEDSLENRRVMELQEEKEKLEEHKRWIKEMADFALQQIPWGVSLPASLKVQILDEVKGALRSRSEDEDQWLIRELVEEIVNRIVGQYQNQKKAKEEAIARRKEAERQAARAAEEARRKAAREEEETKRKAKIAEAETKRKAEELERAESRKAFEQSLEVFT